MARKDIVARIGRLARAVANADRKGDDPAVEKWSVRLADASTSLAVLVNPDLGEDGDLLPPPNFGFSKKSSGILYGDWGRDYLASVNPDLNFEPGALSARAKADGCLAQVCASGGVLGNPEGPWKDLGDWSLFSGAVSEGQIVQVWIMGEKVAEEIGGNAWDLGRRYGLEM